jgi:hypothetical protein
MMSRSTLAIVALSLALVTSNLWWLHHAFDAAITATYGSVSFEEHRQALIEFLARLVEVQTSWSPF